MGVGVCPTYLGACTPQLTFGSLISSCWPSCCERPCSHYPLGYHRVEQGALHPPARSVGAGKGPHQSPISSGGSR